LAVFGGVTSHARPICFVITCVCLARSAPLCNFRGRSREDHRRMAFAFRWVDLLICVSVPDSSKPKWFLVKVGRCKRNVGNRFPSNHGPSFMNLEILRQNCFNKASRRVLEESIARQFSAKSALVHALWVAMRRVGASQIRNASRNMLNKAW